MSNTLRRQCLVMAGGTGGHVFPALAVAAILRDRGWRVAWLGSESGMENRWVPAAGFELFRLPVRGIRGKGLMALPSLAWSLLRAGVAALQLLSRLRPAVVLGMGGFASGPGGLAAWITRRPLVIHEQNAIPGLTNRLLSRLAARVFEAYSGSFQRPRNAVSSGNPIRTAFTSIPAPDERLAGRSGPVRILVLGGSQGARALNERIPEVLRGVPQVGPVWHQSGQSDRAATHARYAQAGLDARVDDFIEDMASAYAWADLVVCRAGAMTVTELAAVGCAALLIPYPHAVDDHQTANARTLTGPGAARLIPQNQIAQRLPEVLVELCADRALLRNMAVKAREQARPDAARMIADACEEVADGR